MFYNFSGSEEVGNRVASVFEQVESIFESLPAAVVGVGYAVVGGGYAAHPVADGMDRVSEEQGE